MVQAKKEATMAIMLQEYFTEQEKATIEKLNKAIDELKAYFVEREDVIEVMAVARLCKHHVVEIGPPGTAKSYVIECFARYFVNFVFFQWQLTKFTTPEEIFGPYSLKSLKNDDYKRNTKGKLPCCSIAYLDEVFNANSSILNALNSCMNERMFEGLLIALENVYGATNFVPEEKVLVAFFDRFLFRFIVDDIHESGNFEQVLLSPAYTSSSWGTITHDEMTVLQAKVAGVNVKAVVPIITKIRELLRIKHIEPSTRRFKWALKAMQARAILSGREYCTQEDVWILRHILWTDPKEIPLVEGVITESIDPDMARIKEFYDQARDIEKQLAPLDPAKDQNAYAQIGEGTQKLKQLAGQIAAMREKRVMVPKVRGIAEKLEKSVQAIYQSILKNKLGVAL